jgi:hypothetical protein
MWGSSSPFPWGNFSSKTAGRVATCTRVHRAISVRVNAASLGTILWLEGTGVHCSFLLYYYSTSIKKTTGNVEDYMESSERRRPPALIFVALLLVFPLSFLLVDLPGLGWLANYHYGTHHVHAFIQCFFRWRHSHG